MFSVRNILLVFALIAFCSSDDQENGHRWWHHPCSVDPRTTRHIRSMDTNSINVKLQMRIFIPQLRMTLHKINRLYSGVQPRKDRTPVAKLRFFRIRKMLRNITTSEDVLGKFYRALQEVAEYTEAMRNIKIASLKETESNQNERLRIYDNFINQMRLLMCEVQEVFSINNRNVPENIPTKKGQLNFLKRDEFDLSTSRLMDVNFFKKTYSFVVKMYKYLKTKNKAPRKMR